MSKSCETFAISVFRFSNVPRNSFTLKQKCVTVVDFLKRPSGAPRNVYHAGAHQAEVSPRGKRYGEGVFLYPRGSRNDARKRPRVVNVTGREFFLTRVVAESMPGKCPRVVNVTVRTTRAL